MTDSGEQEVNHSAPIAEFGAYIVNKVSELEELGAFLSEALSIVTDLEATNVRFTEVGRPDLAIVEPAQMKKIAAPTDIPVESNNFILHFCMYTGSRETGELSWDDTPVTEPMPATLDEILHLKDLPKFTSYDEITKVRDSGEFPTIGFSGAYQSREVFIRMINLFPEFTASLARDVSTLNDRSNKETRFEERLYVAYQIMSHLVDASDRNVTNEQGQLSDYYLSR